uniref:Tectonic family member 3 n=1 Tax=Serinus canaria TaxID=9135 RepID=A0A8C9N482_SERCA
PPLQGASLTLTLARLWICCIVPQRSGAGSGDPLGGLPWAVTPLCCPSVAAAFSPGEGVPPLGSSHSAGWAVTAPLTRGFSNTHTEPFSSHPLVPGLCKYGPIYSLLGRGGTCLYRSVSQVCVEKSLIFRSNTPYSTDIVSNPAQLNYFQQPQDIKESDFAEFLEKYGRHSFLAPSQVQPSFSAFYRAGDPILIYFDSSSVLSVLRQPIKIGASGLCVDGNPAGFLDSKSTSCTRIFANLSKSCMTDPALDAASYYHDFTVLKVHFRFLAFVNVTAVSPPGAPHMKDNTCINVVSEVIYEIEYSGTSGIHSVSVQFKVSNISVNSRSSLQQHFTMHFWVSIPILPGILPCLYILRSESDGSCSQFLRHTVQFGRNMRTGCKISLSPILEDSNCSYIQQKLYKTFQGMNRTEDFAVTGSAHSTQTEEWMTILIENCSVEAVNCTSCCMVPVALEIQILWAKVGLLSNPQAQVLGTRHFYQCHMVPVTTVVTFTDLTDWPEPPRGQPQMHWKLPFDIFFPFKVALNVERIYRGDLAGYLLLILIMSSIFCF